MRPDRPNQPSEEPVGNPDQEYGPSEQPSDVAQTPALPEEPPGSLRTPRLTRRQLLAGTAAAGIAAALGAVPGADVLAASNASGRRRPEIVPGFAPGDEAPELVLRNGKIHTFDAQNRIVSAVAIKNGRFSAVGNGVPAPGPGTKVINLKGRTVVPGIIDCHNHIVLVGNRPGHHVLCEDLFTIPDVVERYVRVAESVPPGEWITTIGPIAARQLAEQRLPNLTELDAVPRPVYIQAAQGGTRTNSLGRAILAAQGVTVQDDGTIPGGASGSTLALRLLREQLLTDETRQRTARDALAYYLTLGITTHGDKGAFHSELPSGGIANENTYTMHNPFLALNRRGELPARVRIDFLHQDPPNDPTLPTLAPRLRNSFPFFGNEMFRTMGIGEFTGGGINGLRAIAAARWRGEDHSLSLTNFQQLVELREQVHAQFPLTDLRWIISHVPGTTPELIARWRDIGGGVAVGWGPLRTGTNVGPAYRDILESGIPVGYHSDGGDITVINPWLNFYTMITGRNLSGDHILGDQTVTREEAMWLATAANKWFLNEEDVGSIEVGNHADLVVLDRDFFSVPDEEIRLIRSVLTVLGGRVVYDAGVI